MDPPSWSSLCLTWTPTWVCSPHVPPVQLPQSFSTLQLETPAEFRYGLSLHYLEFIRECPPMEHRAVGFLRMMHCPWQHSLLFYNLIPCFLCSRLSAFLSFPSFPYSSWSLSPVDFCPCGSVCLEYSPLPCPSGLIFVFQFSAHVSSIGGHDMGHVPRLSLFQDLWSI